jgi:hypothetical protein
MDLKHGGLTLGRVTVATNELLINFIIAEPFQACLKTFVKIELTLLLRSKTRRDRTSVDKLGLELPVPF